MVESSEEDLEHRSDAGKDNIGWPSSNDIRPLHLHQSAIAADALSDISKFEDDNDVRKKMAMSSSDVDSILIPKLECNNSCGIPARAMISARFQMGVGRNASSDPVTRTMRGATTTMASLMIILMMVLLIEFVNAASNNMPDDDADSIQSPSSIGARLKGMQSLLASRPGLLLSMVIRVTIAITLQINLDAFLKLVVTPLLAASVIGAVAAPFTFFVGQALQPIIHSFCFYGFDDKFLMATLEATGGKGRLATLSKTGEWHETGSFHKFFLRWCIKSTAGCCIGFAGLCTAIPIVGPVLTALLSGWVVAWDMVYVPLSGMGRVGVFRQGRSVLANFREYYWFGFWAVLIEEIPIAGPVCHVYNVYSAAFFLERVYLNNAPVLVDGLIDGMEL